MITIAMPSEEEILALQELEQAFYWSRCAEALFRKHGVLSCAVGRLAGAPAGCTVHLRGSTAGRLLDEGPMLLEGPVPDETLDALGLTARAVRCTRVGWHSTDGRQIASLQYSTFSVKRIASNGQERHEPYPYQDRDARWNNLSFTVQCFEPRGSWQPLALARFDGRDAPACAAVTDGSRIVLGAPLFDITLAAHAMPALDDGFYANIAYSYLYALEQWVVGLATSLASAAGAPPVTAPIWPGGCTAGLTIRHDYDRRISDDRLADILEFYRVRGIKATWFLLVDKPPPRDQVHGMLTAGHEVALHTVAPHFDDFCSEVARFRDLAGVMPQGYTCHGGIGSRGQLGLAQYQWAETLGMMYGEMIGRARGLPHSVMRPECGLPTSGRLVIHNSQYSLDSGMRPDAHQLEKLATDIPERLREGVHVVVMNHPDIHWAQLRELIDRLDLAGVWRGTLEEAARWARASKLAATADDDGQVMTEYPADMDRISQGKLAPALPLLAAAAAQPALLDALGREIEDWYRTNNAKGGSSIAATVCFNTTGVPGRVARLFDPIRPRVTADSAISILDVGCGYGGIALHLALSHPRAEVVASDTSDRFYRAGERCAAVGGVPNLRFRVENILELADEARFDVVLLSNVLNYLITPDDLERACANAMRALRPGGWAVVHTPHAWSIREPFTRIPLLHTLPTKPRGSVSRWLGKRNTFHDIRLPSYLELRRFFRRHGGRVMHRTPELAVWLPARTHLSMWVCKDKAVVKA